MYKQAYQQGAADALATFGIKVAGPEPVQHIDLPLKTITAKPPAPSPVPIQMPLKTITGKPPRQSYAKGPLPFSY
jgi:hypothetical protein